MCLNYETTKANFTIFLNYLYLTIVNFYENSFKPYIKDKNTLYIFFFFIRIIFL